MNGFNEPGKKQKMTRSFDTRFKEHDQSIEMNAQLLFQFCGSMKNPKTNLPIDNIVSFLSLQNFFKRPLVPQKYLKLTFINYRKGIFNENDLKIFKITS